MQHTVTVSTVSVSSLMKTRGNGIQELALISTYVEVNIYHNVRHTCTNIP